MPNVQAPTEAANVERTLRDLGVRPARRLGPSFLTDPFVADAEAALLTAPRDAPVFEVGGGLGVLTDALLRRGVTRLTVLERDARLARYLRRRLGSRVEVVEADAVDFDYPADARVIGNLPFSVATPLLVALWRRRVPRVVAIVQREVAERIAAAPGTKAYGRLTIFAALFGTTELYRTVPARLFHPQPEVDGRIVAFTAREGPLPVPSVGAFERLIQALFASRRKQLGNLLPRVAPSPEHAEAWARAAGWPSGWDHQRPEELGPEAYFALARVAHRP